MPEPAQSPDQPTPEIHRSVEQMARLRGLVKLTEPWVCGCGSSLSRLNTKAIHQKTCDGKPYPKPCACGKMLPSQEARHNHYARCPRAKEKRDRNRKDAQGRRPGEEGYLGYPVPIPTLVTTASAAQPPATLTTHASALDLALAALQQDGTELVALSVSALDSSPKAMLAKAREVERLSHAVVELLAGRLTTDASDSDASDSC